MFFCRLYLVSGFVSGLTLFGVRLHLALSSLRAGIVLNPASS
jgi:hypothetical protein